MPGPVHHPWFPEDDHDGLLPPLCLGTSTDDSIEGDPGRQPENGMLWGYGGLLVVIGIPLAFIHFYRIVNLTTHPAIGVPPCMEPPIEPSQK